MKNKIKLKPCPFCGGEVVLHNTQHHDLNNRCHFYYCNNCDASIFLTVKGKYVSAERTDEEAIEVWNRRAE